MRSLENLNTDRTFDDTKELGGGWYWYWLVMFIKNSYAYILKIYTEVFMDEVWHVCLKFIQGLVGVRGIK